MIPNCKNRNLKTYTSLEQLGLTNEATAQEFVNAMPNNSILYLESCKDFKALVSIIGTFSVKGSIIAFKKSTMVYCIHIAGSTINNSKVEIFKATTDGFTKIYPKIYDEMNIVYNSNFYSTIGASSPRIYHNEIIVFYGDIIQSTDSTLQGPITRTKIIDSGCGFGRDYCYVPCAFEYEDSLGNIKRNIGFLESTMNQTYVYFNTLVSDCYKIRKIYTSGITLH